MPDLGDRLLFDLTMKTCFYIRRPSHHISCIHIHIYFIYFISIDGLNVLSISTSGGVTNLSPEMASSS